MSNRPRTVLFYEHYATYLVDEDALGYASRASQRYSVATLERLVLSGERMTRRAAAFALGLLGGYSSNPALGQALLDEDRGVRSLAEGGIRALWCRHGSEAQRRHLSMVIRLNSARRFADAVRRATRLIDAAPFIAEAWNQRAIAYFSLGRFQDSIHDCHQTLEINPYHFGAASGMGQCYSKLGDNRAALESFRRALRLNPNLDGVRAQVEYLQRKGVGGGE